MRQLGVPDIKLTVPSTLPHEPPMAQAPKPISDRFQFVRPKRRVLIVMAKLQVKGIAALPRGQGMSCPPFTSMIWPVMYPDRRDEARNR